MRANDAFRTELHETIRSLRSFAEDVADVARIDLDETDDHFRLQLVPHEAAACPVELIVHVDQTFDISIARETYEHQTIEQLSLFRSLLTAISAGRVIQRTWSTAATGAHLATATLVSTENGIWQREHADPILSRVAERSACLVRDRHFAPYRSATSSPTA